jgi:hypothetical protein
LPWLRICMTCSIAKSASDGPKILFTEEYWQGVPTFDRWFYCPRCKIVDMACPLHSNLGSSFHNLSSAQTLGLTCPLRNKNAKPCPPFPSLLGRKPQTHLRNIQVTTDSLTERYMNKVPHTHKAEMSRLTSFIHKHTEMKSTCTMNTSSIVDPLTTTTSWHKQNTCTDYARSSSQICKHFLMYEDLATHFTLLRRR